MISPRPSSFAPSFFVPSLLVIVALCLSIVSSCGRDVPDSASTAGSSVIVDSTPVDDLLIEPTVDLSGAERPIALWFWAPG